MKITACLFCVILSLAAREASAQEASSSQLVANTADFRQIEFYTGSGGLSFTLAGQRYILPGHSVAGGYNDASVAANLAVLAELRHATKVTLILRQPADPKPGPEEPKYLSGISFEYDSLK